jgi:hypothetical protein
MRQIINSTFVTLDGVVCDGLAVLTYRVEGH